MKTTSVLLHIKATVLSVICIILAAAQPVLAIGKPHRTFNVAANDGGEDPVINNKEKNKRNKNSIKMYMDAPKKKVHVIAKEKKAKQIDFFVFDLEGTLVHNHKMKPKDHHRIGNLAKGIYVYRVFCGDEETASGQFEIK